MNRIGKWLPLILVALVLGVSNAQAMLVRPGTSSLCNYTQDLPLETQQQAMPVAESCAVVEQPQPGDMLLARDVFGRIWIVRVESVETHNGETRYVLSPLGLAPGDVYVYDGNNLTQSAIGSLTPGGGAGHVAIEVAGGYLLTARPGSGVTLDAPGSLKGQNVTIMRPVSPVNTQGLLEFVKNSLGKNTDGYDYSAILAGKQTKDGSEYTCASLVAEALRRAGVPVENDKVTTPNNILNDPHLKKKCP